MLYLNNENEPTSFDPPIGFNNVSWQPLNNIMEGLTRLGKENEPEPAMAEKWSVSNDKNLHIYDSGKCEMDKRRSGNGRRF